MHRLAVPRFSRTYGLDAQRISQSITDTSDMALALSNLAAAMAATNPDRAARLLEDAESSETRRLVIKWVSGHLASTVQVLAPSTVWQILKDAGIDPAPMSGVRAAPIQHANRRKPLIGQLVHQVVELLPHGAHTTGV
jgi:hypothetical protein